LYTNGQSLHFVAFLDFEASFFEAWALAARSKIPDVVAKIAVASTGLASIVRGRA
jgi:hypothetical protein